MQQAGLCPSSCLILCPQRFHHSSLCSPAAVQQPRALGRTLYIESVTMYCPHVYSQQAEQGQVRILAIGTFTFSTNVISFPLSIPLLSNTALYSQVQATKFIVCTMLSLLKNPSVASYSPENKIPPLHKLIFKIFY